MWLLGLDEGAPDLVHLIGRYVDASDELRWLNRPTSVFKGQP